MGRAGQRACRSRSTRWTASTAPAASPSRSGCRRSPTPRAAAPAAAPRSTAGCTSGRRSTCIDRWRDRATTSTTSIPTRSHAIADEVEAALSTSARCPGRTTPASELLRRGAAALGWRHSEIPRWMTYPPGGDAVTGARQSMTRTYLPRAFAAGARMVVGCRVDRLVIAGGTRARAREVTLRRRHARRRSAAGTCSSAAARSRRRRCCSDRASAAGSAARSPCTRP